LPDLPQMSGHQFYWRDLLGTDHFGHFSRTLAEHALNLAVIQNRLSQTKG